MNDYEHPLRQIGPGIYSDPDEPDVIVVHLGELLASRKIEDVQQTRAALYGEMRVRADESGLQLVLVAEDNVPSIEDFIREHQS